jgi:hypothetical protein
VDAPGRHRGSANHDRALRELYGGTAQALHEQLRLPARPGCGDGFPATLKRRGAGSGFGPRSPPSRLPLHAFARSRRAGEPPQGFRRPWPTRLAAAAWARVARRLASVRPTTALRLWHRRDGAFRTGPWRGPLSPWKKRAACRWQRRCDATDSSAEQSLEVGCFAGFRRARSPTPASAGAGAEHGNAAASVADLQRPPSGGPAEGSPAPPGASQPPEVARLPLGVSALRHRHYWAITRGPLELAPRAPRAR